MEKEASYYVKRGEVVQCQLCPHFCVLKNNQIGKCHARQNINGKLISLSYNKPCSLAIDPIEKKPLYHFIPGARTLSIATCGCNFACKHCQNWQISQKSPDKLGIEMKAESIVNEAKKDKIKIISYTYTEPTIFYEYMTDIAKIARKNKIKNVMVTNGFINPEPLKELCKFIDAANVDIKGNEEFYERVCHAKLQPVLKSIKIMKELGVFIEITNLLIPGLNDSQEDISQLADFIKNIDKNIPVHFTAFYPQHKMVNLSNTSEETLIKARNIALAKGLKYVYNGIGEGNNTYCPKCHELLIKRSFLKMVENKLDKGKCFNCQEKIFGVWQ